MWTYNPSTGSFIATDMYPNPAHIWEKYLITSSD